MPTFTTPEPPALTIDLGVVGDVHLTAADRDDTVVEVRPHDAGRAADVRAAEQTRVTQVAGRVVVTAPRHWRQFSFMSNGGAIDVTISAPTGSSVDADLAMGRFTAEGELGRCTVRTAYGDVRLDHTGALEARSGYGDVTVDEVSGDADVSSGSGTIRVSRVDGQAVIKNSNGHSTVTEVTGDLQVRASNGDITVNRAHRSVSAKSANGAVRVADVTRGSVSLDTSCGDLEVGIRPGTAAWLDVRSHSGSVRNHLDAASAPADTEETVEVRGRTSYGDITITRATS